MNDTNIKYVEKNDLCTGCGTCVALCPNEAIKLYINENKGIYIPKINEETCAKCSICINVCPRHEVNFNQLKSEIFKKNPDDYFIGKFLNCYTGNSNDFQIRYNSSSGGLITQLLIFALDEGIIDGVLVTRMKKDKPLEPEPFIARTREEIIDASKSKYCPVPANIALKEILKSGYNEKFAVVGLPCHINGIKKAEAINKKLKKKIVLKIGILCSHTNTFKGTEYLYTKLNIKKEDISKISYRGLGWPGKVAVKLKSGKEKKILLGTPLWKNFHDSCLFAPTYCLLCNDLTAEFSDISFGDAWLPEIISKERNGKSLLISRTKNGEELLNSAVNKGFIELIHIDSNKVIESQQTFLFFKKINIRDRIILRNFFKKNSIPIPNFTTQISFYNKLIAFASLINSYLGSKFMFLLCYVPIGFIKMYISLYYTLMSLSIKKDLIKPDKTKRSFNILILNAHWNNRGDEAAIRAMIDSFTSNMSVQSIKIMFNTDVRTDLQFSGKNSMEILVTFPFFEFKISFFVKFFIDFFLSLISLGHFAFSKKGKDFISAINDSNLVIHAPGGPSIGDIYSGRLNLYEYFYLYKLFLPKLKGKKVYIYAPSMGPFSGKFQNFIRKFILKKMDLIIVRDKISKKYLKDQLNLDSYLALDSAFQNDIPKTYLNQYFEINKILNLIKTQKVVGMTITDLNWHPSYINNTSLKNNIITAIENAIDFVTKKGYYVIILPQLFGLDKEIEKPLIDYIKSKNNKIFVLPQNLDSYAQQSIISNLFCVIGMRYHPNIFAAKMNIPSIAIYYEHKTKAFMKELGRLDLTINIEKINAQIIIDKFLYLEKNYDTIKRQITEKNPHLKEKSKKTTKLIINDLHKSKIDFQKSYN